jgi:hypothetical protein
MSAQGGSPGDQALLLYPPTWAPVDDSFIDDSFVDVTVPMEPGPPAGTAWGTAMVPQTRGRNGTAGRVPPNVVAAPQQQALASPAVQVEEAEAGKAGARNAHAAVPQARVQNGTGAQVEHRPLVSGAASLDRSSGVRNGAVPHTRGRGNPAAGHDGLRPLRGRDLTRGLKWPGEAASHEESSQSVAPPPARRLRSRRGTAGTAPRRSPGPREGSGSPPALQRQDSRGSDAGRPLDTDARSVESFASGADADDTEISSDNEHSGREEVQDEEGGRNEEAGIPYSTEGRGSEAVPAWLERRLHVSASRKSLPCGFGKYF